MATIKEGLTSLLALTEQMYPDWSGFSDPRFLADEIEYKRWLIGSAQTLLARSELADLLASGNTSGFLARLRQVAERANLLYVGVPKSGDLRILFHSDLDVPGFCAAIFDLLHGPGSSPDRLFRYIIWVDGRGLPNYWTFPTYFLFVCHPASDFFVKPVITEWFLQLIGQEHLLRGTPTAHQYGELLELMDELMAQLADHRPKDMVDIQSLIWVAYRSSQTRHMAKPFSTLFETWADAESWLGLLTRVISGLDASGPDDPRFGLTIPRDAGILRLNFGNWPIIDVPQAENDSFTVALLSDAAADVEWPHPEPGYASVNEAVARFQVPADELDQPESKFWPILKQSLPYIAAHFASWDQTPFREYHQQAIFEALFDEDLRERMLADGPAALAPEQEEEIPPDQKMLVPVENSVADNFQGFSADAFTFFEELQANNNKEWMHQHKEQYASLVREPLKGLFTDIGPRLKSELAPFLLPDELEIEPKVGRCLASINKQWSTSEGLYHVHFWGAFYRQSLKKQTDAQLFVTIQADMVRAGFYIGSGAHQVRDQFRQRVLANRELFYRYARQLGWLDGFAFIREDADTGSRDVNIDNPKDLDYWLSGDCFDLMVRFAPTDPVVTSPYFADELLAIFKQLIPAYLWAAAQDPVVAVENYLNSSSDSEMDEEPAPAPYGLEQFTARTYLEQEAALDMLALLDDKKQLIFYGPPGTGKTHVARELAKLIAGREAPPPEQLGLVQFHAGYGYREFIEGVRPISRQGGDGSFHLDSSTAAGVFRQFCLNAQTINAPCVFLIDEINRGDIAQIFGELMLLLEYRDLRINLPYSGQPFHIPDNVYIVGTMNTADPSAVLTDYALRRRFHFYWLGADPEVLEKWLADSGQDGIPYLPALYRQLCAEAIDDPDYRIGPGFFMKAGIDEAGLRRLWKHSIEPYLMTYHREQRQQAERWGWDGELVSQIRDQNGGGPD